MFGLENISLVLRLDCLESLIKKLGSLDQQRLLSSLFILTNRKRVLLIWANQRPRGEYYLSQHLRVRLGVLDLQLGELGHTLLEVRHPPLLLHGELRLGRLGHLLEGGARLLLSARIICQAKLETVFSLTCFLPAPRLCFLPEQDPDLCLPSRSLPDI